MPTPQQRIIKAASKDGRKLVPDYSGRAMFGDTCLAVDCPDPLEVIREVNYGCVRQDQLGLGYVVYWPYVKASATEIEQITEKLDEYADAPDLDIPDMTLEASFLDSLLRRAAEGEDVRGLFDEACQHSDNVDDLTPEERDQEAEERKRIVEDVSKRVGGLTKSEADDIRAGD